MNELVARVALVTGAGAGIGRATAFRLAEEGAVVGALDLSAERAKATVAAIEDMGGQAAALTADVSNAEQMNRAINGYAERFGRLDLVVSNAGINGVFAPIDDLQPEEWDRTIAVNLRGTFLTFRNAVPWLRKQGGAAVIIASVQGTRIWAARGSTAYACAKSAQQAFARKVAVELAGDHIRVNTICPGAVDTQIEESTTRRNLDRIRPATRVRDPGGSLTGGRRHRPEEVAELACFLLSPRASGISGTEVWIDGAASLS